MATTKRRFKTDLCDQLARISTALAKGCPLELIDLLSQEERTVESLSSETEQPAANASHHLQTLHRARLVTVRQRSGSTELPKAARVDAYCHGPYCVLADKAVRLVPSKLLKPFRLETGVPGRMVGRFPVSQTSFSSLKDDSELI